MRVYSKARDIVAEATAAIKSRLVNECPMARDNSRFKVAHVHDAYECSMCYIEGSHYRVTEASGRVWYWCGECKRSW
jgi:hypothetical protein